jgi:wobble nucleotide-excising tRNase
MSQARIRRIKKIGDYRAFKGWTDGGRPNEFKRVNLIYGSNGSGKSTLASLIRDSATDATFTPAPQLEFEIEMGGSRSTVTESDATFWPRVRVFNADYVRENLRFDDASGPSSDSLLTLGKPNVDAEKELKEAQAKVDELSPRLQPAKTAADTAENQLQRRLTAVAGSVVDDLRQSSVATYRATGDGIPEGVLRKGQRRANR